MTRRRRPESLKCSGSKELYFLVRVEGFNPARAAYTVHLADEAKTKVGTIQYQPRLGWCATMLDGAPVNGPAGPGSCAPNWIVCHWGDRNRAIAALFKASKGRLPKPAAPEEHPL